MQNPVSYSRIKSLDYLRGIMAFSIMIYHFYSASFHKVGSETVLGRIGIYGVSVFYVLSGLTLYIVYKDILTFNIKSILSFTLKRIFRIFPLLWIALTLSLLLRIATSVEVPSLAKLFVNYTGLFGFINPNAYITAGEWSIGNELVFYAFFPIFLVFSKVKPPVFYALCSLSVLVGVYFALFVLTFERSLSDQWATYINPFNQLVLFTSGILVGYAKNLVSLDRFKRVWIGVFAFCISVFIFYRTGDTLGGEKIEIVTGFNRVMFLCISIMLCASVYYSMISFSGVWDKSLSAMGDFSYGLYLLHPLVYPALVLVIPGLQELPIIYMILGIALSVLLSFLVYKTIEFPIMKYGKKLTLSLGLG